MAGRWVELLHVLSKWCNVDVLSIATSPLKGVIYQESWGCVRLQQTERGEGGGEDEEEEEEEDDEDYEAGDIEDGEEEEEEDDFLDDYLASKK